MKPNWLYFMSAESLIQNNRFRYKKTHTHTHNASIIVVIVWFSLSLDPFFSSNFTANVCTLLNQKLEVTDYLTLSTYNSFE